MEHKPTRCRWFARKHLRFDNSTDRDTIRHLLALIDTHSNSLALAHARAYS